MIFVQAPSHQTKMFVSTRVLGRKYPFLPKVEEDKFFSVQSTKNIAKFLFLTSQPQWVGQWEGEWARPAGLTPTVLNDPPGQPYSEQPTWFLARQVTGVCTERWRKRARVLSLSFRLFRAVGSSFGPVWFSPPSQERRFVLILQNPLGGATNFFEIIPGNRYAKVVKTKICKFFWNIYWYYSDKHDFWSGIIVIEMYFRMGMFDILVYFQS